MKNVKLFLLFTAMAITLSACGRPARSTKQAIKTIVWYLDTDEGGLVQKEYEEESSEEEPATPDPESEIEKRLELIRTVPEKTSYHPLLDDNVTVRSHELENGVLTLDFSPSYRNMSNPREVLARAGLVRTFTQIDGVSGVRFLIAGSDALSPQGEPLGIMNGDTFVEDAGKQINAIQHVAINLYFTGENGTTLKREARSIYYTASKPLEWAIVERIIAGPKVSGNYATVPANTQIISVTSANGTCYVNLNQTFLTNALNIDEQIPIYSIVNSLIDDCKDITQVQISVEGGSNLIFRQSMDLSHPYEADYTLVEAAQTS